METSSVTDEFISNKHALDQFLYKKFNYTLVQTPHETTIIDALKKIRNDSPNFGFDFIDVIQRYTDLLRQDVRLDDDLLKTLEHVIDTFKKLLEPWVHAYVNAKKRAESLKDGFESTCKTDLSGKYAASENPSQNFMHQMVAKLCAFFTRRIQNKNNNTTDEELASTLYLFCKVCDQLLLPILKQLKIENETSEGKKMIKVFNPRIHAYVKGGRRTRRHKKRSGHNKRRSNKKRMSRRR